MYKGIPQSSRFSQDDHFDTSLLKEQKLKKKNLPFKENLPFLLKVFIKMASLMAYAYGLLA